MRVRIDGVIVGLGSQRRGKARDSLRSPMMLGYIMRFLGHIVAFVSAVSAGHAAAPSVLTVNDAGDAGDGTCATICTLRDAIANVADGGTIDFDPAILPATITLQQGVLSIQRSLYIAGPGAKDLSVSGGSSSRLIEAHSAGSIIVIADMTLRDGAVVMSNGTDGAAGTGDAGGGGNFASGGCIAVFDTSLKLQHVLLRNCLAKGGDGGNGGSGVPKGGLSNGGLGGAGGPGGEAAGGAISSSGATVVLDATSIINALAIGGKGGAGGDGGTAFFLGNGGAGGAGGKAFGGAYFGYSLSSLVTRNTTIARGTAAGGNGGNGGSGDISVGTGGKGGDGGGAQGGLIYAVDSNATLDFSTLGEGTIALGSAGGGGIGHTPGSGGATSDAYGAAVVAAGAAYVKVHDSAIVGSTDYYLCQGLNQGSIVPDSPSLDGDGTCGAVLQGSLPVTFRPLVESEPLPTYRPLYASGVIDHAGSCTDSSLLLLAEDVNGTPRPQGLVCDIGAVEADFIFVDGFE